MLMIEIYNLFSLTDGMSLEYLDLLNQCINYIHLVYYLRDIVMKNLLKRVQL